MKETKGAGVDQRAGSFHSDRRVPQLDDFEVSSCILLSELSENEAQVWKDYNDFVYWKLECEEEENGEVDEMGNLQSDSKKGKNQKIKSKSPAKSKVEDNAGKDSKKSGVKQTSSGERGGAIEPTNVVVTDSWRHVQQIQEKGTVVSGPPSDDSSSPDEVFAEPGEMATTGDQAPEPFVTTIAPNFTIVKHRKADLGPTLTDTTLSGILSGKDDDILCSTLPSSRRFSSQSETQLESNVLRKVASLTLDRATIENKTSRPKFSPPKLDFQLYEKFEGGMLINWLGSSVGEEIKQVTDWKQILARLCSHLLSLGVIRQVTDKEALPSNQFRTDLMYYWAHNESVQPSCPPTPGRLSKTSWPPSEPTTPVPSSIRLSTDNLSSYSRKDLDQISISSDMKELAKINQEQKFMIDDLQTQLDKYNNEKERLKTLADIQALTNKMQMEFSLEDKSVQTDESFIEKLNSNRTTFLTPTFNDKFVQTCDSSKNNKIVSCQTSFDDKLSSLNSLDSYKSAMESLNLPNITDDVKVSSLAISKSESSIKNNLSQIKEDRVQEKATDEEDKSESISLKKEVLKHEAKLEESIELKSDEACLDNKSDISSFVPGKSPSPPPMPGGSRENMKETISNMAPPPPPMPCISLETYGASLPPPVEGFAPPPPPMPSIEASEAPLPPPMLNLGPPAPPMPGLGPPPPPMPVMGPPPPPMPSMGPPPPPMPGIGGPPAPPMPGLEMPGAPLPPPIPGIQPPPMPGVPPPPPSSSPVPFPSPPIGGWNAERSTFRKQPLLPPVPMKPLYWTRVVVLANRIPDETDSPKETKAGLWGELEEAKIQDIDEFTSLFSRQVVDRKNTKKKITKPTKAQVLKVLDSKRSQNVGILATSLHLDFSEIENAVYNFDTSVVSLEALQQIYDVRASDEELMMIREQQAAHNDQLLDKPEQFLLELAEIPHFAERIACFMFQAQFTDNITSIENKLNNLKSICQFLVTSESVKNVFSIILALGNFMNGGNRQRGQADGFGLEILSKLKDVKSKDNSITLLHYIVKMYVKNYGDNTMSDLVLPVPEPGDLERASSVSFESVQTQIQQLKQDLNDCIVKVKVVIESASSSENVETFKNKMEAFVTKAETNLKDETENLAECKQKFIGLLKFYQYQASGGKLEEVEPKDFFSLWTPFSSDFKDLWKKEENLRKAKIKETLKKQKEIKKGVKKVKIGGFKSTLLKFQEEITNVKN